MNKEYKKNKAFREKISKIMKEKWRSGKMDNMLSILRDNNDRKKGKSRPLAERIKISKTLKKRYANGELRITNKGREIRRENNKKWKSNFWKGGVYISKGYRMVKVSGHPYSNSNGYVLLHRLLMEIELNRFLNKDEVVHHKNKDKLDNNILNLQLFPNAQEHIKFHRKYL